MKPNFKILTLFLMILALIFMFIKSSQLAKNADDASSLHDVDASVLQVHKTHNDLIENSSVNERTNNQGPASNQADLYKIAESISRKICEEEQIAFADVINQWDSEDYSKLSQLTTTQLGNLLNKAATSSCGSFRKGEAERLFRDFELSEQNYKTFNTKLKEFVAYEDYGYSKLVAQALIAIDGAVLEERAFLLEAIVSSLKYRIDNMASFLDAVDKIETLKKLSAKNLITHSTNFEIDRIRQEYVKSDNDHVMEVNQRYQSFLQKEDGNKFDSYEGAKINLELHRGYFESAQRLRKKLNALVVVTEH